MKSTFFRRTIVSLLCLCLLLPSLSVFASAEEADFDSFETDISCPTIFVHGFACGNIYTDIGTEQQKQVWPMDNDTITTAIETAIDPIIHYLLTHNWEKFESALIEVANILFEPAWSNADGTPPENSGILWSYPAAVSKTDCVDFCYDWRKDPLVVAAEMNDFIDYVLEKSGAEKVAIECHSMGGPMVMAYIAQYGMEKIHGVVLDSTAIYGAGYMGKLFSGDIVIDGEALYSFLLYALDGTEYEIIVDFIFDSLYAAGVFDIVELFGEVLIHRSLARVAEEVLIPLFARWPSIWAMISDEEFDLCEKYVFEEVLADATPETESLREKVNAYDQAVRPKIDGIIRDLYDTGHFMIISKYGYSMAPVTETWQNMSDGVLDTYYTSFGATCALYDEYLPSEYIEENKDKGYISPDGMVDASTCDYPDSTWFIRNDKHSTYTSPLNALKKAVLFGTEKVDIYTFAEYPQYLIRENDTITAYTEYEAPAFNILYEYGNLMQRLRDMIEDFLRTVIEKILSRIPAKY